MVDARSPWQQTVRHDVVLAAVLFVLLGVPSLFVGVVGPMAWFDIPVSLAFGVLVAFRRVAPLVTLGAALVLACIHAILGDPVVVPAWMQVLVLLYTVGRWSSVRDRILGALMLVAGAALAGVFAARFVMDVANVDVWGELAEAALGGFFAVVLFGFAMLVGGIVDATARGNRAAREREAASALALANAERAAIEEERAAIARDMHDVVAHSLAVVIAQANGARYAGASEKDASLARISETARGALGDVRVLLAQLRHSQAADPAASVAELDALVDRMRAAGLDVRATTLGTSAPLARTSDIAAYRILQESLTNALRHGDRSQPVHVRLTWGDELWLDVHNRLLAAPGGVGHGITGMRERASLVGGTAWAGQDGEWFRVHARFPVQRGLP